MAKNLKALAARQHAFDDHYVSGEWIDDLSELDAKDLLKRLWEFRLKIYQAPEVKFEQMAKEMIRAADHHCTVFSDKNEADYLEGTSCQSV